MKDRLNSDTPLTNNIRRYLKELESRIGVEQVKKFVVLFEQGLDDLDEANTYTELRQNLVKHLDKNAKVDPAFIKNTQDVYFSLEVMVDVSSYDKDDPELAYRMRDKKTDAVKHLWSHEKFRERLDLMREWHSDLESNNIKARIIDPWMDVMEQDEDDAEEESLLTIED